MTDWEKEDLEKRYSLIGQKVRISGPYKEAAGCGLLDVRDFVRDLDEQGLEALIRELSDMAWFKTTKEELRAFGRSS